MAAPDAEVLIHVMLAPGQAKDLLEAGVRLEERLEQAIEWGAALLEQVQRERDEARGDLTAERMQAVQEHASWAMDRETDLAHIALLRERAEKAERDLAAAQDAGAQMHATHAEVVTGWFMRDQMNMARREAAEERAEKAEAERDKARAGARATVAQALIEAFAEVNVPLPDDAVKRWGPADE